METLFGTGTALYDAIKRLVPDSGNTVAATERGLEYAPLIASALVECAFFNAGVPGPMPMRKAHGLAVGGLCTAASAAWPCRSLQNHIAGRPFEAQRSATVSAEPDEEPDHARDNRGDGPFSIPRTASDSCSPRKSIPRFALLLLR